MGAVNSHVSAILLGVNDMQRSKRFYTEGLGWKVQDDYKISVFFVPHGGSMVGFYGRDGLADMVGASPGGSGFSGVVFNYIVRRQDRVDEVLDEARKAGGRILKPAAELPWGGYGGTFADPDGYVWSIAYGAEGQAEGQDQVYAE
jgi:predicted enzyme related to lactoylglutathione lyase